MKELVLIIETLLLFSPVQVIACSRRIVLSPTTELSEQINKENVTYVIKHTFDLKGKALKIPDNCCLVFKSGKITNGTIDGSETNIIAKKNEILKNVILTGSWVNKRVYSEWLDFKEGESYDNADNFRNLMLLCTGREMTHLYMRRGTYYCSIVPESSNINVPSNLYWHNSATICQMPTSSQRYGFVLLQNSENVTIEGGAFIGDVKTHIGNEGEWGHGIKVAGAKNVVLKNITIREFWGDGIDLIDAMDEQRKPTINCENIRIEAVKCIGNRRQGLSIESGINVEVLNSEFVYTGKNGRTPPGAGIDIEPWNDSSVKIMNIRISKCKMLNNWGFDLQIYANYKMTRPNEFDNHIEVSNCEIGTSYVYKTNGVKFKRCRLSHKVEKKDSNNITIY